MVEVISNNNDTFYFSYSIWGRRQKVKIMCGTESTVYEILPLLTENIKLIDRNRDKIGRKIFDDRYSEHFRYCDDIIDNTQLCGSELEHFLSGLYISKVRVEVYKNNEFDIIFTVRSKKKYRLDFDYDECVLYYDHSFEI